MERLELRKRLLFDTKPADFSLEAKKIIDEAKNNMDQGGILSHATAMAIRELSIDLQSYLVCWNIQKANCEDSVKQQEIDVVVENLYKLLASYEYEQEIKAAKSEAKEIANSNLLKIAKLTDEGKLNNRLGNDAYYGLTNSMRRGCALVTTNPVMINTACKDLGETRCLKIKEQLKKEFPNASTEKLVTLMTAELVYGYCLEMLPIFEATDGKEGYISLQVNPRNSSNTEKMFEEVDFIYDLIKKRIGKDPNLVFKVPATKAGLSTVAQMMDKGIGVNVTGSCAFNQIVSMAEIIETGNTKASFLTLMSGRLDDRIADELIELGVENATEKACKASAAIMAKSYNELCINRGYKKAYLLAASARGPWNVSDILTDGATPIYMTLFPPKAEEFDEVEREVVCSIHDPIDAETMKDLEKSKLFQQAYHDDGLTPEEFEHFYPVKITLESFCKSYDETYDYMSK